MTLTINWAHYHYNVYSKFENNPSSAFWVIMFTQFIPKTIQMEKHKNNKIPNLVSAGWLQHETIISSDLIRANN